MHPILLATEPWSSADVWALGSLTFLAGQFLGAVLVSFYRETRARQRTHRHRSERSDLRSALAEQSPVGQEVEV